MTKNIASQNNLALCNLISFLIHSLTFLKNFLHFNFIFVFLQFNREHSVCQPINWKKIGTKMFIVHVSKKSITADKTDRKKSRQTRND